MRKGAPAKPIEGTYLRKGNENDHQSGQEGREAANNVKHPSNKDGKINEHIAQVGQELDPKCRDRKGSPNAKIVGISCSPLHAERPVKDQKDKCHVEVVAGIVQPNVKRFERQKTDNLHNFADEKVCAAQVEWHQGAKTNLGVIFSDDIETEMDGFDHGKRILQNNHELHIKVHHQNTCREASGNFFVQ